jgi:GMP synthase (glutamine-hydrolysing)
VLHADESWAVPDVDRFASVASLGAMDAGYDDSVPWLARELELLGAAHAAEVPVLGICFGAQSLARSLGAVTRRADIPETGWHDLEPGGVGELPNGPWLFWHDDSFEVPAGGRLLGRTAAGPAAFRAGTSLGVQFHP